MDFSLTGDQVLIRDAVREACARFPGKYWRDLEAHGEYRPLGGNVGGERLDRGL